MFWFCFWLLLQEMNSYFVYGSIGVYVKVKVTPWDACTGTEGRWKHSSQPIRNLGARSGWAVSTAPAALPPHCTGPYVDIHIQVYLLQTVIFLNDHFSRNIELVTIVIYCSMLVTFYEL